MSDGMMGPGMRLWMVVNLFFWLLVIAGIILLAVWAAGGNREREGVKNRSWTF
jgi:hypothetical protein